MKRKIKWSNYREKVYHKIFFNFRLKFDVLSGVPFFGLTDDWKQLFPPDIMYDIDKEQQMTTEERHELRANRIQTFCNSPAYLEAKREETFFFADSVITNYTKYDIIDCRVAKTGIIPFSS